MKVRINAGGREVEVECADANVTYEAVADKALQVWHGTVGAKDPSAAYGFTVQSGALPPRYADFDHRPAHVTSGHPQPEENP